jgi:hypothetical protein
MPWSTSRDVGKCRDAINLNRLLNYLHSALGSHQAAWTKTSHRFGDDGFPSSDMSWGIMSAKYASHWAHVDAAGMGTFVRVMFGGKLWIVFRKKKGLANGSSFGDLNSVDMFGGGWQPHKPFLNEDEWEAEAVWLTHRQAL